MQSSPHQPEKKYSFSISGTEPLNQHEDRFTEQHDKENLPPEVQNTVNDLILQDMLAKEDAVGNREK